MPADMEGLRGSGGLSDEDCEAREDPVVSQYWEPMAHHASVSFIQVNISLEYEKPSPLDNVTMSVPSELMPASVTASALERPSTFW